MTNGQKIWLEAEMLWSNASIVFVQFGFSFYSKPLNSYYIIWEVTAVRVHKSFADTVDGICLKCPVFEWNSLLILAKASNCDPKRRGVRFSPLSSAHINRTTNHLTNKGET